MCGVRGRIFHELEVVFKALVLCLKGTETLMYSSFVKISKFANNLVCSNRPVRLREAERNPLPTNSQLSNV